MAWCRLETAKRRLIYTLLALRLPLTGKAEAPESGLTFQFLADPDTPGAAPVLTGHNDGVITVNIAEADDSVREKRRHQMHEGYRTLLGHFRHEVGHYYWDRLVRDGEWIDGFRELFGDEREDYDEALQRHYKQGAPADWQERFVSAYASSHPWEDWAETWAHYLHMTDTLETAIDCGLSLRPKRSDEPSLKPSTAAVGRQGALVRSDHRGVVPADVCAEQPQPRDGPTRRLSLRPVRPGDRKAWVRSRTRQAFGGAGRIANWPP